MLLPADGLQFPFLGINLPLETFRVAPQSFTSRPVFNSRSWLIVNQSDLQGCSAFWRLNALTWLKYQSDGWQEHRRTFIFPFWICAGGSRETLHLRGTAAKPLTTFLQKKSKECCTNHMLVAMLCLLPVSCHVFQVRPKFLSANLTNNKAQSAQSPLSLQLCCFSSTRRGITAGV